MMSIEYIKIKCIHILLKEKKTQKHSGLFEVKSYIVYTRP